MEHLTNGGRTFVISSSDLAGTAGTEIPRILIRNPVNSGKTLKIFKIEESVNTGTGNAMFRYYKNPTISVVGTLLNPANLNLNTHTSSMTSYLNPTISNNGTRMMQTIAGQMYTLTKQSNYLWILNEGVDLLINVRTNAAGTTWNINLYYAEVDIA